MMKFGGLSCIVLTSLAVAGCGRLGLSDPLERPAQPAYYEPLPAAPTAPVTSSALPPPPTTTAPTAPAGQPVPGQPGAGQIPVAGQAPGTVPGAAPGAPQTAALPGAAPATTTPPPAIPVAPAGGGSTEKAPAIGRGEFSGGWRVASGADNCQLFTSLTSWSGGYRASTRGCNSAEMQRVSAWDITGKQVVLKAGDGSTVATLNGAGPNKFQGTTATKQAIVLSR